MSKRTLNSWRMAMIAAVGIVAGSHCIQSEAEPKGVIYRPRLDDTEFLFHDTTGFMRSYHRISSDSIVDYVSLEEEGKSQILLSGLKGSYDWKDGTAKILSGKVTYEDAEQKDKKWAQAHLDGARQVLFGDGGADGISLISEGKLVNKWSQTFAWRKSSLENEDVKTLSISWKRNGDEIVPFKAIVAFPRHSQTDACILQGSGCVKLEDRVAVKVGKDARISVPVMVQGSTVEIRFDCAGSVQKLLPQKMDALVGGWKLEFTPDDAETVNELSMVMDDRNYKRFAANGLELAPNLDTGCCSAFLGGIPLFQTFGVEGKRRQGRDGAWTAKYIKNKGGAYFEATGSIASPGWKTSCRTNGRKVDFKYMAGKEGGDSGVMIKVPYDWVGGRFQLKRYTPKVDAQGVVPPYGESEARDSYSTETAFAGAPLRIGACLNIGAIPEGSVIEWFPTESEKVSFVIKQDCKLVSGREAGAKYDMPFDITSLENWKDIATDAKSNGPMDFNPDAFLCLYPVKDQLSLECRYERVQADKAPFKKLPASAGPVKEEIQVERTEGRLVVKTPYWEVAHDGLKGWVPCGLSFPFGLGRDILKAPLEAYLTDEKGQASKESDSGKCELQVDKPGDGKVVLTVKGELGGSGVPFMTEYVYDRGGLRRTLSLDFSKKPSRMKTIGVIRIETDPILDYAKYKPCLTRFAKAVFPGAAITQGNRITAGVMGLYRQNGEGIDFSPSSDLWKWYALGESKGFFAIKGDGANPVIIAEAFHVDKAEEISRRLEYSHYIGLPEVREPMPRDWRAACVSMPSWCTDKVLASYAESGVNIAITPLGNQGCGEYSIPLPDEVIRYAGALRKAGMLSTPFFIPSATTKRCKEAMENIDVWSMGNEVDGKCKPVWSPPYLMCCYESKGYLEFTKNGIRKVAGQYPNDGIYCDFIYQMGPCGNKIHHGNAPHVVIDGLLDLCSWIKSDLLRKDQVFFAHTGYCPVYNVERYCDLAWIWEEMNYSYSNDGRPVSLFRASDSGVQASNIQRVVDPHPMFSWITRVREPGGRIRPFPQDMAAVAARLALNGVFPLLHNGEMSSVSEDDLLNKAAPFLKLFKAFKGVRLSQYQFMDWKAQNSVTADDPAVRMAVYAKERDIVLVAAVPEDIAGRKTSLKVSKALCGQFGLKGGVSVVETLSGERRQVDAVKLSSEGMPCEIDGLDFKVIRISKD